MIVVTLGIALALGILVALSAGRSVIRILGLKVAVDSLATAILGLSPKDGAADARILALIVSFSGTIAAVTQLYGLYKRSNSTQSFKESSR